VAARVVAWAKLRLVAAAFLGFAVPMSALEPATPLASYGRQAWVMENGLPQNTVQALAQTRDGFVWLGTEVGLVRFDGNNFVVFDQNSKPRLPGNDVQCLLATGDGALWVGTGDGLARMQNGSIDTFTTANGLPANSIQQLRPGPEGSITAFTPNGNAAIRNLRVEHTQLETSGYLFAAPLPGGLQVSVSRTELTISQKGHPQRAFIIGKDLPGTRIQIASADRSGMLWVGTNGGLIRYATGRIDRFPVTDPLASASILSVLEDHEGNLWVGTETGGVHILRDERFRTFGTHDGLSSEATSAIVADKTGTLWVGTTGSGLNAINRTGTAINSVKTYTPSNGLTSDIVLSLASAPNGDLWVGTPDGLNRIRNGAVSSYTTADGLPDDFIRSVLVDPDGSLWVGTRRGLAHAAFGPSMHVDTYTHATGLGSDLVGAMARDQNGNLWVATLAGLSRLSGGAKLTITNFTAANGLSSNVITALLARSNGSLLIGTQDHGWNLWDGNHFSPVVASGLDRTTIHAILDDEQGHLWFATGNGIARCDCDMSGGCSHWMEFGPADGLRGREMATNSHPSAWHSVDGLLWFATPKGIVEVDPKHFPVNTVAPPVAIVRFAADDVDQPLQASELKVPAGHNHFQFDYAGLSYTAPQKVRYRYMLEGFDHRWTEAGIRRSAYYTNIPPGHYTFRIQACNNDGVWNSVGSSLAFTLRPHFYQTIWFYFLLALFAAGLVFLLLRLRLLQAEREFRAVLAERNRIAREVHDTLAQGYVGVSVQLEVLTELLRQNKTEGALKQLDTTRKTVREGLSEARQSIWALRSQDSDENTLPVKLRRATEHANGNGLEASFSLYGAYRPMSTEMEREFLRVGQEAIHNVKRHAGAKHLNVELEYGPAEVALVVRDDGGGFSTEGGAVSPPGHYGLMGMRERSEAIGGTLEVTSEVGSGTTVRLQVMTPKEAKDRTVE
jgi:signal transduction histidine kinase/ligand-binding sensor domain-containing protein